MLGPIAQKLWEFYMLKNPSQDTQVSVTSLWQRTRKTQDGPEEAGTQQLSGCVHLPAIHPVLSSTPADEHCKACPGTEPCHQQKGEINENPRGNQV